jgi:hypothetical protein
MSYYLLDRPPVRDQFRSTRRATPTGCIVLHTTENSVRVGAARDVARFIERRSDPGSYHLIGDQDEIVEMMPFGFEAYGDATGSNRFAIHIAVTAYAADRPLLMTQGIGAALVDNMAVMARMAADWLESEYGIAVPAQRITRAASDAGDPGFISHSDRDPARRHDPGKQFPWGVFLEIFHATGGGIVPAPMNYDVAEWQSVVTSYGANLGPSGIDGRFGPATLRESKTVLALQTARADQAERALADVLRLAEGDLVYDRLGRDVAALVASALKDGS